jgi:hypothetical protein
MSIIRLIYIAVDLAKCDVVDVTYQGASICCLTYPHLPVLPMDLLEIDR